MVHAVCLWIIRQLDMSASSTERWRLREQRIRDGRRLVQTWLDADQVDALADYGFLGPIEAVDSAELGAAIQALARGLCRRGIAVDWNWAMGDALPRDDKPRGDRMVARLSEREHLSNGYRSAFGCPQRRVLVNVETV